MQSNKEIELLTFDKDDKNCDKTEEIEILDDEDSSVILAIPLKRIKLSNRLRNGLLKNNVNTLQELIDTPIEQIQNFRYLGANSINEAVEVKRMANNSKIEDLILPSTEKDIDIVKSFEENYPNTKLSLIYSNLTVNDYNLSTKLRKGLAKANIKTLDELIKLSPKDIKKIKNLGRKSQSEIYSIKLDIIKQLKFSDDNSKFISSVIRALSPNHSITIIKLKNFLERNTNYPTEKLIDDISILRNHSKVKYTMDGIEIIVPKLLEVINLRCDEEEKSLILERLNGKTLQEIAVTKGLTRERIRQKILKIFFKIPSVYEDKYKEIYEEYSFDADSFCKIMDEQPTTFNYLNEKYKQGMRDLYEGLEDDRFDYSQKSKIKEIYKIAKIYGETIVVNKNNVIRLLIEREAKEAITIEKFTKIYNEFCTQHSDFNLMPTDPRSLDGVINRLGVAIFSYNKKFRYYDYDSLDEKDIESLKNLYELDDGYYTTSVLFKNNPELMSGIDINNEYELHNLSKNFSNQLSNITFDRMPNFSVNSVVKKDFFESKMKELSPISVTDFLGIMENEYGHKYNTMSAYITSEFKKYITNGIINVNITPLNENELKILKTILKKPIYTLSDLKNILKEHNIKNCNEVINQSNIYKIGYRLRSSYILRKDIISAEDYITDVVKNNDFVPNENILKNNSYFAIMKKLEQHYDIFLISNNEYITIRKLHQLGLEKQDIENICTQIKEEFNYESYFTLGNVRENISLEKLEKFGFDDIFYENIIGNIADVSSIRICNQKVYSFLMKKISAKQFVLDVIKNKYSMSLDEIQQEILNKYKINVSQEKIKYIITDSDYYYSDLLNKVYQDKKYYYEEVYNYDK